MCEDNEYLDLRRVPLVGLIAIIVEKGSRTALCEFHDRRTVFNFRQSERLRLAEYVACLRDSASKGGDERVADEAYGLTIDRFSRLPAGEDPSRMPRKVAGVDCRNYFRPFLSAVGYGASPLSAFGTPEMEYVAAKVLQGLVARHFRFALADARRQGSPGRSRYTWTLPHGRITLMMPAHINGRRRRTWLEQNVDDPDLRRPGERDRVQSIIDEKLGSQTFEYKDELDHISISSSNGVLPSPLNRPDRVYDLAEAVADEKADSIEEQRTTIRYLGVRRLRDVIHRIFALLAEEMTDGDIARQVGLDKVTYSRFAGRRWGARASIPDLWANTAHVLASNPEFAGVARRRLRARIESIIQVTGGKRHGRPGHD